MNHRLTPASEAQTPIVMPGLRARLLTPLVIGLFVVFGHATAAAAQDTAEIRVSVSGGDGQPSDATVSLTPEEGGAAHSCTTRGGRCVISSVPRGRYVVTAASSTNGQPPLPRVVWVPPRVPSVDVRVRMR